MPDILIRNVPEDVKRDIRIRAARHGRTIQQEALDILISGTRRPLGRNGLGTRLHERFADIGFPELGPPSRNEEPRAADFGE